MKFVENKTRARLTWYACVALTLLGAYAIYKGFEGVASTCIAGIMTGIGGYQASRGWTKTTAMKNQTEDAP